MIAITITSMKQQPKKKEEPALAPLVDVFEVKLKNQPLLLTSYGVISPKHQTSMMAEVSGRIVSLDPLFVAGGKVKKGQVLAQIDPSDYEAALLDAQANYSRAQAALLEEQARGKVAAKEWRGATSSLPPELGLRKPQLAREQANIRSAQAMLARAERNLQRTQVVAPYDALINKRQTDIGQFVAIGSSLGLVSSINTAEIRLPVSSSDYAFLSQGVAGKSVTLSRQENGQTISWQATLLRDEGTIDQSSRMIYLVAEVKEPYLLQPALKFGTFVDATIESQSLQNIAVLPSYLYKNGKVAVIGSDLKLVQRSVTLFKRDKNFVYIKQGLADGELLAVTKLEHVYDGMAVRLMSDEPEQDKDQPETQLVSAAGDE